MVVKLGCLNREYRDHPESQGRRIPYIASSGNAISPSIRIRIEKLRAPALTNLLLVVIAECEDRPG
jgi:hypothetical protein